MGHWIKVSAIKPEDLKNPHSQESETALGNCPLNTIYMCIQGIDLEKLYKLKDICLSTLINQLLQITCENTCTENSSTSSLIQTPRVFWHLNIAFCKHGCSHFSTDLLS